MLNLKDFLMKIKELFITDYKKIYTFTPISEEIYKIIKEYIKKDDNILEFGSSTGHISYQLAKEGYNVTLLDIRPEVIKIAQKYFLKNKVKANFICTDIFNYDGKHTFAWNSGLIQCFEDSMKEELIKKIASISPKMLLFYPDTDNPLKKRGTDIHILPGVGNAKEYSVRNVPQIAKRYFTKIYQGTLDNKKTKVGYNIYFLYTIN